MAVSEKSKEESLQLGGDKYKLLFELTADALFLHDLEGRFADVNQSACESLGYTRDELLQLPFASIVKDGEPEALGHLWNRVIQGEKITVRGLHRRKDGTSFPVEVHLSPFVYGEASYILASARDISESQRIENALRTSDALLNSIIDQSPYPMWIADHQGILIRINRACLDLLHPEEEQVVGNYNIFEDSIVAQQGHAPLLRRVFEHGESVRFELQYDRSRLKYLESGQAAVATLDVTAFPIKDGRGRITHAVVQFMDITQHKQAEEALAREKAFSEAILDSLPGTFFLIDAQLSHLRTNTSGMAISGYSWAEMSQMHALEFITEEDRPAAQQAIEEVFAKGEAAVEARMQTKDGRKIPFLFTARQFLVDNTPYLLGTGLDVTKLKEAEDALRESEERYRSLFQNNHSVMLLIDPATGAIMDVNPAACKYYGFSREELLSRKITDINILAPTQVFQEMETAQTEKRNQFEFRHRLAGGEIRDVEVFSGPIRIQDKELLYSIVHDITARKQAETALAESEHRFAVFMDHLPAAAFIKDEAGRLLFANHYLKELFGWQECIGKNTAELLSPEFAERMMADDQRVMREGLMVIPERITDIRGVEHFFQTYKFPITVEGSPGLLGGIAVDATDSKRMEQALEKRLVALSRPLDEVADIDFNDLFNLEDIQQIQDLFARITGVASLITAPDGTPLTQPSNFSRFCRDIVRRTEVGRQRCAFSDAMLGCCNPDGPTVQHCLSAGLCGAGASITVGGKHVANWLIGQVRDELQSEERIREYAGAIGVDADEFLAAFGEIPIMPAEQFNQVARALFVFANHLSAMAYQNIQQARFITESQRAEEALRVSEQKYRSLYQEFQGILNAIPDVLSLLSPEMKIIWTNAAAAGEMDPRMSDNMDQACYRLRHGRATLCEVCIVKECFASGKSTSGESTTPDGKIFELHASPLFGDQGEVKGVIEVARNITERRRHEEEQARLEAQMREVQRLESLGVLAGGIAHDFNNLLMAILGNADLALLSLSPASPARPNVERIAQASQRAADLCGQMLAYSGKGRFVVGRFDLSEIVREMTQMLEVSISKKAALRYSLGADLPPVEADATQLRQVIMNLITNASEALSDQSGYIAVSTGVMDCDRDYLSESYLDDQLPEGRYVYLEVSDTGNGMDEKTRRHIFDPFFTTKFTGRGLGLAAVLGIVRGHKGAIKVYSEPGQGTIFKVLFPAVDWASDDRAVIEAQSATALPGSTILIIDDDPEVRSVGASMLERLGYRALTAAHGREGLEVFRDRAEEIACVILDLTMPEMSGEEVFRELQSLKRDVCVILSSGYNEQDVIQRFAGKGLAGFIQKPYRVANLREMLNAILGAK